MALSNIKMTMFFVNAVLMSLLPFYRVEFPVAMLPNDFMYIEYSRGEEIRKITVNKNDFVYLSLKNLILTEKQGWQYDLGTYSPSHTFNSPELKINCLGSAIVVNYKDATNGWVQISKKGLNITRPSIQSVSGLKAKNTDHEGTE